MNRLQFIPWIIALGLGLGTFAMPSLAAEDVVIYSSVDEPFLTPLIKRFEKESGKHVRVVTDTEATKSAGLAERLEAEMDRPQADVYWNNEFVHTIRLAERGAFAPYRSKAADDVPARYRPADDTYQPIGLRARVIVISTRPEHRDLVANIHNVRDLADPKLKGKVGICNPAVGTASAHLAALRLTMGDPKFATLLAGWKANDLQLLGGNSVVVDQVGKANLVAGLTDNDDVANGRNEGLPIDVRVPDQADGEIGTLMIPTTISLIKGAPHAAVARQFIDFLCDPKVERELVDAHFLKQSVRDSSPLRAMTVDPVACSKAMRATIEMALKVLQAR